MALDKARKGNDEIRDLNSQFKGHINDPKVSVLKETLFPLAAGLKLLKTKFSVSFFKYLNFNTN